MQKEKQLTCASYLFIQGKNKKQLKKKKQCTMSTITGYG